MREDYESTNFNDARHVSKRTIAFENGERHYSDYDEHKLIDMLQRRDIAEVYKAFGAIGKLKLKKALPYLKTIALNDEDIATQEDAIRTIRSIGGRTAIDILRSLTITEHRDLVEQLLAHGA